MGALQSSSISAATGTCNTNPNESYCLFKETDIID